MSQFKKDQIRELIEQNLFDIWREGILKFSLTNHVFLPPSVFLVLLLGLFNAEMISAIFIQEQSARIIIVLSCSILILSLLIGRLWLQERAPSISFILSNKELYVSERKRKKTNRQSYAMGNIKIHSRMQFGKRIELKISENGETHTYTVKAMGQFDEYVAFLCTMMLVAENKTEWIVDERLVEEYAGKVLRKE